MTFRNKKRHHDHVKKLKKQIVDYNVDPFSPGPVQNFANGKEIDFNIIQGLLDAGKTGDKTYVNERLVEGKKSIFDTIRKSYIKTGVEMRKIKKTKEVSVLTEDKQAFGTIVAKATSLHEVFTYPITPVPLSVATPCGSLYQSHKLSFRNELLNNSKSSNCSLNATWIIDEMFAVRSVQPRDTYRQYFVDLFKYIIPPKSAQAKELHIVMDTYKSNSTITLHYRM